MEQRRSKNGEAIAVVLMSFAFALFLAVLPSRIPGFPLHPLGYALAMNFGIDYVWFGLTAVLLIKVFVDRVYGVQGRHKLHSMALGIILGECCAESIWSLYAILTHHTAYSIAIDNRTALMR